MDVLYLEIELKSSIFQLPYQPHNSSADCARELFKPSNDTANFRVCNGKKLYGCGFCFLVNDVVSKVGFIAILALVTWTMTQLLDGSILLKFSLETKLGSESF